MTFVNRLSAITPGMGTPMQNDALFLKQTFLLSGTLTQINVMPATGAFVPTISKGKIRIKVYPGPTPGTSPSVTFAAVFSDGTNFVEVARVTTPVMGSGGTQSGSIPNYSDRIFDFELDINASYCYLNTVLTGTAPVVLMDVEISGTT